MMIMKKIQASIECEQDFLAYAKIAGTPRSGDMLQEELEEYTKLYHEISSGILMVLKTNTMLR